MSDDDSSICQSDEDYGINDDQELSEGGWVQ